MIIEPNYEISNEQITHHLRNMPESIKTLYLNKIEEGAILALLQTIFSQRETNTLIELNKADFLDVANNNGILKVLRSERINLKKVTKSSQHLSDVLRRSIQTENILFKTSSFIDLLDNTHSTFDETIEFLKESNEKASPAEDLNDVSDVILHIEVHRELNLITYNEIVDVVRNLSQNPIRILCSLSVNQFLKDYEVNITLICFGDEEKRETIFIEPERTSASKHKTWHFTNLHRKKSIERPLIEATIEASENDSELLISPEINTDFLVESEKTKEVSCIPHFTDGSEKSFASELDDRTTKEIEKLKHRVNEQHERITHLENLLREKDVEIIELQRELIKRLLKERT